MILRPGLTVFAPTVPPMRFQRPSNSPLRRLAFTGLAFLAVLLSCGKDVTAPGARGAYSILRGNIAVAPQFPEVLAQTSGASGTVPFNRVHVVLRRVDLSIAFETTVNFPADATTVPLVLDVPLLPTTPASGESLTLTLEYLNAAGEIVFTGGPTGIVVTPTVPGSTPPPAVSVPVKYSGTGANAKSVKAAPRSLAVPSGSSFSFTAQAFDANNTVIAGTPVVFSSLDPSKATINAVGVGTAIGVRGTVRIVAQLLTGPSDTVDVSIQPVATAIAVVSGSGQTNSVGATLAQPIVVKVTAADGLAVAGTSVSFVATTGGGTVTSTATTDASGNAQATWKLGATVGPQSVTASAGPGGQVVFTATATAATPTKLVVTSAPTSGTATAALADFVVTAQDANNNAVSAFTGSVIASLGGGTAGATLSGTTTLNAVGGVATFTALGIGKAGTAYTLTASSNGLTAATSTPFNVVAGTANKLVFTTQPADAMAGASIGTVTVAVQDAAGNALPSFVGAVTLAIGTNPGTSTLSGTATATTVAGVATFTGLSLNKAGAAYTLVASATGLVSGTSAPFNISIGAASTIVLVSGGAQSGPVSSALALPIVVQVSDAASNAVVGKALTVAVTTGGGTVTPTSVTTIAGGLATVNWTLGATPGAQSITVSGAGLTSLVVTATATGAAPATQMAITAGQAQLGTQGVQLPTALAVTVKDATNNPVAGYTVNWAVTAGGGFVSAATSVTDVAGIATINWTLGFGGVQTAQATGAGLTGSPAVFNATAAVAGYNKTWTGATSTAWVVTTNWAPSGVPVSGDSVYVPAGGNQPTIASSTTVTHLGMGNGAVLTVNGSTTLTLLGKLNVASIVGAGTVDLNGAGNFSKASPGTIAGNVIVSGTYTGDSFGAPTVGGNLTVTGSFALAGTMTVTGNFATSGTGTLTQSLSTSQLNVTGTTTFAGGSETGKLTNGWVGANGGFTQSGSPTSFVATGLHAVVFSSASNVSITLANPTTATFASLTFNGGGNVTINNDITTTANLMRYGGAVNGAGHKATIGGMYNNNAQHLSVTFDSVIFVGSSTPVAPTTSVIVGPVKFTSGTPALSNPLQVNGNAVIDGTAAFSFSDTRLRVTGDFTTAGSGVIKMNSSGDQLDVYGNATFGGGSTTGLLTDGVVNIQGSFAQITTPTAYAPSGLHLTNMSTTPVKATISFANPNNSFFQHAKFQSLVVDSMLTNVWVQGNLQVLGPQPTIGAVGTGLTIGGTLTDVSGLLAPAALSFGGSTTPVSATTPSIVSSGSVTFNNNPSILAANLNITSPAVFVLGNLSFPSHTLAVSGDFATSSAGQLTMSNALDSLKVAGNVTFGSSSAGGPMTNGVLLVDGNFTQSGSVQSLSALASNTIVLSGTGAQTVNFSNPDGAYTTGCAASCFANLNITKSSGSVAFQTKTKILGAFTNLSGVALTTPSSNGDFIIVGAAQLAGNGAYHKLGLASGTFSKSGVTTVDTTVWFGTGQTFNPATLGETFDDIRGTVNWTAPATLAGNMQVNTGGELNVATSGAVINGKLTTSGNGTIKMTTNASDSLHVKGYAQFAGGSTDGLLTKGYFIADDSLDMTGLSYSSTSNHTTVLGGANLQKIFMSSPIAGKGFNNVWARGTGEKKLVNVIVYAASVDIGASVTSGVTGFTWVLSGGITDSSSMIGGAWRPNATNFTAAPSVLPRKLNGTVAFKAGNVTLADTLYVGANSTSAAAQVVVDGGSTVLTLNGFKLQIDTVVGVFTTQNGGKLNMTNAADTLKASNFFFGGGNGTLNNGTILAYGNFTQWVSGNAFAATSPHVTYLKPKNVAGRTISFTNSGFSGGQSHFGDLYFSDTLSTSLATDVYADGELETGIVTAHPVSSANKLLTSRGANVSNLTFTNTRWLIVDGAAISFANNVQFLGMVPTATQFEIQQNNSTPPATLSNFNFNTVPTGGGLYLKVTDTDGATNGNLNVTMSNPSPAVNGGFVSANGGATISGWSSVITAVASANWGTASTWSPAIVPSGTTPVIIPNGYTVTLTGNQTAGDVTLTGTSGLSLGSNQLAMSGNLTLNPNSTVSCAFDQLVMNGTGKTLNSTAGASLCGTRIAGTITLAGGFMALGNLNIVDGGTLTVGGNYITTTSLTTQGATTGGALKMTNASDSVIVTGTTHFGGVRNTTGLLTNGSLVAYGDVITDTGFIASGSHKVWMASSSAAQSLMAHPGSSVNGFNDLIFEFGGPKKIVPDPAGFASNVSGRLIARAGSAVIDSSGFIWLNGGAMLDSSTASDRFRHYGMYVQNFTELPDSISTSVLQFENTTSTLSKSLRANSLVLVNASQLTLGGKTLQANSLTVQTNGLLVMNNATDSLLVSGTTSFDGGNETGLLTNGVLRLGGNFTQLASLSNSSFRATGNHKTVVAGTGTYTFATPGSSLSQFGKLFVNSGITMTLASDIETEYLETASNFGSVSITGSGHHDLHAADLNLPGTYPTNFNNVSVIYVDGGGSSPTFNYASFGSFGASYNAGMLVFARTTAGTYSFSNLTFFGSLLDGVGAYAKNVGSQMLTLVSPNPAGGTSAQSACGCTGTNYKIGAVTWP
jgi:hypothetical protein